MKIRKLSNQILICLALGGLAAALRRALYAFCVDDRGLLPRHHPLTVLLIALTVLTLGAIAACVRRQKEAGLGDPAPSVPAAAGDFLSAAGILVTILTVAAQTPGYPAAAWRILGALAAAGLAWAGVCHIRGAYPPFPAYLAVSLFYIFHIVDHYRGWSGNPQLMDFTFTLLYCAAMALYAYYCAAAAVGLGRGRMRLGTGLAALFLGVAALSAGECLILYGSGIAWVAATVGTPGGPKPEEKKEAPNGSA